MELFLNLTWTLIVAAAALRFARWSSGQPNRRRRLVGLATLCVLAVLLPIISVTDDLHSDVAMLEETNGVRRSVSVIAHLDPAMWHTAVLRATAPQAIALLLLVATIAACPAPRPRDGFSIQAAIRPPPGSRA